MKAILYLIVTLILAASALGCHIQVHTYDGNIGQSANLEGVSVTLAPLSNGWVSPNSPDATDVNGKTISWRVAGYSTNYTAVGVKDGWVCTPLNQEYTPSDAELWQMPCYQKGDVPEFGLLGGFAVLGLAGLFIWKRR